MCSRLATGIKWRAEAFREALVFSVQKGRIAQWGPYRCPVCGRRMWRFLPLPRYYHDMQRQHGRNLQAVASETCNVSGYLCASCNATDRDRLYALYLRQWIAECHGKAAPFFLDIAPSGPLSNFICSESRKAGLSLQYKSADLMMDGVDLRVNISCMPEIHDCSVDFFLCSHVLEHVPDDQAAMRELFRILKPGGKGILMVPINLKAEEIDEDPSVTDEGERWRRFGQGDHVREYSREGFLGRVRAAGFVIYELGREQFGRWIFWRSGISQHSVLYVVERPEENCDS